jgi:hypothetical protein
MQEDLTSLVFLILAIVVPVALLWMGLVWAITDAKERNGSQWLAVILVFFAFPIGLLIWLMVRPRIPTPLERRVFQRRLQASSIPPTKLVRSARLRQPSE